MADVAPNQTLYVQNLSEKVKPDEMRRALYALFKTHGTVLELAALRTKTMRGQAFIVFDQVSQATAALNALQGFQLFDRPMRVAYSKNKSDIIARRDGTWKPRAPKQAGATADKPSSTGKRKAPGSAGNAAERASKRPAVNQDHNVATAPNHILFATNLPTDVTQEDVHKLFSAYPGLQDVRLVPGNTGMAFIEFATPAEAGVALHAFADFHISEGVKLQLSYAKK